MTTSCSGGRSRSTRFELPYVLGNLAGLFVTGTLTLSSILPFSGVTNCLFIFYHLNTFILASLITYDKLEKSIQVGI